ncbi:hypothetical protein ASF03_00635 [Rhizobium sp. Leaf68]|nr:hypothetical protein ASE62_00480 [Rhizobium sp. Leaf202]KQN87546.1 hypothetical protein ASF03_00635 [Rhizobium sp. Leaf68]
MKSDKIRKLLLDLDDRLRRAERLINALDFQPPLADQTLRQVNVIRMMLRRYSSKSDTVAHDDVTALHQQLEVLREIAKPPRLEPVSKELGGVLDGIAYDYVGLSNLLTGIRIGLGQLGPEEVFEVTPGQKTAAFQFLYQNEFLDVVDQPLRASTLEREIAFSALEGAIDDGKQICLDLTGTNVSPRLRHAFQTLQECIEKRANVVQIGQRVNKCSRLVEGEIEELSSSLAASLLAHIEMVSNAISQFEEWRIYCENAASLAVTHETVSSLIRGARELARSLDDSTEVSPAVVEALEAVADWAEDEAADKRDLLSLGRTIENVCSAVIKPLLRFARDVGEEVRKMAIRGIAVLLIGSATLIVPVLSKIPGAEWVQPALSFVKGLASSGKIPE